MPFVFANYECYSPEPELRELIAAQASHAVGLTEASNYFKLTRGCRPGTGHVFLRRSTLDKLLGTGAFDGYVIGSGTEDKYLTLRIVDTSQDRTFPKIIVSGHAECVSPGGRAAADSVYLVPIADRRWLLWYRGEPLKKAYNLRSDSDGTYIKTTLNGSTAWTWQQMLADIWPATAAGSCPDLPFTPDGTPEGFWYANLYRWRAVQHVLDRLGCTLKYDPIIDVFPLAPAFKIVRLGVDTDATELAWRNTVIPKYGSARIWDDNAQRPFSWVRPDNVRVRFPVKPLPSDPGELPWYTKDIPVSPSTGTIGVGTYTALEDDLYALKAAGGVTPSNDGLLATRATERAGDYCRVRDRSDRDDYRRYSGAILDDAVSALGSTVAAIVWQDQAPLAGRPPGLITSFYSGVDAGETIEKWHREELDQDECCNPPPGPAPDPGPTPGPTPQPNNSCCGYYGIIFDICPNQVPGPIVRGWKYIWYSAAPGTNCKATVGQPAEQGGPPEAQGLGIYVWVLCDANGNPPPPPPIPPRSDWCQPPSGGKAIAIQGDGGLISLGRASVTQAVGRSGGCGGKCGDCKGGCGQSLTNPFGTGILDLAIAQADAFASAAVAAAAFMTIVGAAADEARNNTTTLSNDATLQFAMEANKTYAVTIKVYFDCGNAGGADGFKFAVTGPAAPTLVRSEVQYFAPGALTATVSQPTTAYPTSTSIACTAQNAGVIRIDLIVQNGANAGTLAFQFAQATATVVNTQRRAGSYLKYRKVN